MLADQFDSSKPQKSANATANAGPKEQNQVQIQESQKMDQKSQSEIKEVEQMMEDQDITTDQL